MEVLRAQGAVQSLERFFGNIESIVDKAMEEENEEGSH
jgi:hypothetical protein